MRVMLSAVVLLTSLVGVQVASAQERDSNNESMITISNINASKVNVRNVSFTEPNVRNVSFIAPQRMIYSYGSVASSAWRGTGFHVRWEPTRKCIVKRESEGNYRVVNRHSGAQGAYQFMPFWTKKLAKMLNKKKLAYKPISRWSRLDQDRAFWAVWQNGRNKSPWRGGRWSCGF